MKTHPGKPVARAAARAAAKRCAHQFRHTAVMVELAADSPEHELAAEYVLGAIRALQADLKLLRLVVRAYRSDA